MGSILYQVINFQDMLDILRERARFLYYYLDDSEIVIIAKPYIYRGKVPDDQKDVWDLLRETRGMQISRVLSEERLVAEI